MSLLDWIYPPACMSCRNLLSLDDRRQRERWLCAACEKLFEPLAPPVCVRCGRPVTAEGAYCVSCQGKEAYFSHNRAVYVYEDLIREMIHEMKFRNKKHIAAGLGVLLADACAETDFGAQGLLVPVPMHPRKKRARGFNQAEIMAEALSKKTDTPVLSDLIRRTRNTPPQSGLSFHGRAENMTGAFALNKKYIIENKSCCLIDDIYTTGATLDACAKILQDGGAAKVFCITLSVAVKKV